MSATYKFKTFQELVDRVPSDKIALCMKELGIAFGTAKAMTELVNSVARNMAAAEGETVPPPDVGRSVIRLPEEIEWIDDGLGEIQPTIKRPDGRELFSLNIKINPNK